MKDFESVSVDDLAQITGGKKNKQPPQPPSCGPTISIGSGNTIGSNNDIDVRGNGSKNRESETTNGNGNNNGRGSTIGIPPLLPGATT